MSPEIGLESIDVAALLSLGIVLTGLFMLVFRRRCSWSGHRKHSQLAELSAQFRAVAGFLERYTDIGEPKQRHSPS